MSNRSGGDCHFNEMLHKNGKRNIFGDEISTFEGRIACLLLGGVYVHFDFSLIRVSGCADEIPGHWEAFRHDVLGVSFWGFKELL